MKKYLIKGLLALFGGTILVGCADHDVDYVPLAQQKTQAYDQAFKDMIGGDVDPNQNWGFDEVVAPDGYDPAAARAFTRADGNWAGYHGAQTDGHLWTSYGFHAPDPLTDGQKLRVQYYFQMNKITNPNQPNNGEIDFFMQQVYDGGTDPMTKYKTGNYSREVYTSTQNTDVESGQHMDHLTASDDKSLYHVNNFNNGNYPDPITNVADWNQTVQDDPSQEHKDWIMLMLNTPTKYFGYANSDDSFVHKDMWTLVSAKDIDTYCNNNGFAEWLSTWNSVNGKNVADDIVDDEWHRGFIGFDFEMLPSDKVYVKNNGVVVNAVFGDANGINDQMYFDGTNFLTYNNWSDEIKVGTKSVPYLDRDGNQYCGGSVKRVGSFDNQPEDYPETAAYDPNGTNDGSLYLNNIPGKQSDLRALNLKFIAKMYNQGYRPVQNTGLRLWVIVGGCADGYYSDWIVSFLPASSGGGSSTSSSTTYHMKCKRLAVQGRVFCEDLGQVKFADIDFNDIVFDARIWWTYEFDRTVGGDNPGDSGWRNYKYEAEICLLAAGGTITAKLANQNVHDLFKVGETTMVNTYDDHANKENMATWDNMAATKTPVTFTYDLTTAVAQNDGKVSLNLIPIEVMWTGVSENEKTTPLRTVGILESEVGGVPHKVCAPIGTVWPSERQNVTKAFPNFEGWATKRDPSVFHNNPNTSLQYTGNTTGLPLKDSNGRDITTVDDGNIWTNYSVEELKSQQTYIETETVLWSSDAGYTYGANTTGAPNTITLYPTTFSVGDKLRVYETKQADTGWIVFHYIEGGQWQQIVGTDPAHWNVTYGDGYIDIAIGTENQASHLSNGAVLLIAAEDITITKLAKVEGRYQ